MLMNLFIIGLVVLGAVCVLNPVTGKVILAVVAGSTGVFGRWLRQKFPNWIMQYEIDKASRDINYYWSVVEELKTSINGLTRSKNDKQSQINNLTKLSEQAAKLNTPEGDADAIGFLKDKKRLEGELNDINTTLAEKEDDSKSAVANITAYQEQVKSIKAEAEHLSIRLKTKKADAALSRKLSGLRDLNSSGLAQAREGLNQAMDAANAGNEVDNIRNHGANSERKYTQASIDQDTKDELAALKSRLAGDSK